MTQLKVKKFIEWVCQVFICYLSLQALAFVICVPPLRDAGTVKL